MGRGLVSPRFDAGRALFILTRTEGESTFESSGSLPCELVRSGLKLPSCPRTASFNGRVMVFKGRGWGHGEGLDVESAKASRLGNEELLERAYGRERLSPKDEGS